MKRDPWEMIQAHRCRLEAGQLTPEEQRSHDLVYGALKRKYEREGRLSEFEEMLREPDIIPMYFTKEEADIRIQELMAGPASYSCERDSTYPVIVTREELIEDVKKRIRPGCNKQSD